MNASFKSENARQTEAAYGAGGRGRGGPGLPTQNGCFDNGPPNPLGDEPTAVQEVQHYAEGVGQLRDQIARRIPAGEHGWWDDEFAVVKAACELAVHRYFGSDYDVRSVTKFAAELRRSWGGTFGLSLVEFEAVIRVALAGVSVDLDAG